MKKKIVTAVKLPKFKNFKLKIELFLIMFCSFVGVGFVSGAEIYEFFLKFGNSFYLGLIVFFILVFVIIYKMIYYSKISKNTLIAHNFTQKNTFLKNNQTKLKDKNNVKYIIKEIVFGVNSFVISGAMFAGLKYFLRDIFSEQFIAIYLVSLIVVFLILVFGVKLLSLFDVMVFIFILVLFVYYIFNIKLTFNVKIHDFLSKNALFSIFFSILYVFMNLLQMQPLIEISTSRFETKADCKKFSIAVSCILTSFLLVFILMLKSNFFAVNSSMPFLEIFKQFGGTLQILFCIGLVFAIVSTQVSGLIGLKDKLEKLISLKNTLLSFFIFVICFVFGLIPFKVFVSIIYPILGVINFFTIVFC